MCPTGPGVFLDVQVVKKRKKKKNHPLPTHKTIALFFLMKKRKDGGEKERHALALVKMSGVTAKSECGSFITNTIHTPPP